MGWCRECLQVKRGLRTEPERTVALKGQGKQQRRDLKKQTEEEEKRQERMVSLKPSEGLLQEESDCSANAAVRSSQGRNLATEGPY